MLVAHDSQAIDLSLYYGYAYLILGDPGAVSRGDKLFVVNREEPGLVSILQ